MKKNTSALQAIRNKCLDCNHGSEYRVANCNVNKCALYPFRMGINPYYVVQDMSREEREALAKFFREKSNIIMESKE